MSEETKPEEASYPIAAAPIKDKRLKNPAVQRFGLGLVSEEELDKAIADEAKRAEAERKRLEDVPVVEAEGKAIVDAAPPDKSSKTGGTK